MTSSNFIAINWGSTNFAAYLLEPERDILDKYNCRAGVTQLDREGIAGIVADVAKRWIDAQRVYASGMIGSTVGWVEAPYHPCPASLSDLVGSLMHARIGGIDCRIVPGLSTDLRAEHPDVMRGEEMEIFGALIAEPALARGHKWLALPGTHTKWVRVEEGRVVDFFTSMSGEIYDRLVDNGLLASVIEGDAHVGAAFMEGVRQGAEEGRGVGRLLFSVRARVIRGSLARFEAASVVRGLLIGAEIADALEHKVMAGFCSPVPVLGNPSLCALYAAAFAEFGIEARKLDGVKAISAAFLALDAFVQGDRY